tara:strand:+ start:230 stop:430 length:201 start_codon:yes stop_codon:yes gene_type:complete
MRDKKFRLVKDIKESNILYKKGYEDDLDYPNYYNSKTGRLGISTPHYGYVWAKREDYIVINTNKEE